MGCTVDGLQRQAQQAARHLTQMQEAALQVRIAAHSRPFPSYILYFRVKLDQSACVFSGKGSGAGGLGTSRQLGGVGS